MYSSTTRLNPPRPTAQRKAGAVLPILLALVLLLIVGSLWLWWYHSQQFLRRLKARTAEEEQVERTALAERLAAIGQDEQKELVEIAISTQLLGNCVAQLDGIQFKVTPDISITLDAPKADFHDGFPHLEFTGIGRYRQNKVVKVTASVVLRDELKTTGIYLRPVCIDIVPRGRFLPAWAAEIASAEAVSRTNAALKSHSFRVPLRSQVGIDVDTSDPFDLHVDTPGGKIVVKMHLPELPTVYRWIEPHEIFFGHDALHVLAKFLSKVPSGVATPQTPKKTSRGISTGEQIQAAFAPWRLRRPQDFAVRAPRSVVADLIADVNQWKPEQRRVTADGAQEEGSLLSKTGGLPAGKGFKLTLKGDKALKAASTLHDFTSTWDAPHRQIGLALTARVEATGQIDAHANIPATGGVGVDLGIEADTRENLFQAALRIAKDPRVVEIYLLAPRDIIVTAHLDDHGSNLLVNVTSMILNAWIDLSHTGFKLPLPHDKPLAHLQIPDLIVAEAVIPAGRRNGLLYLSPLKHNLAFELPDSLGWVVDRDLILKTVDVHSEIDPDKYSVSGRVEVYDGNKAP